MGISRYHAWYRGHRRNEYRLVPTILRRSNGLKHERNLYALFKTQSARFVPRVHDSWEVLAIMQHHGVPTRFLDWTQLLHAALFFALEGKIHSPCIWILNPFKLNQESTGRNIVYDQADKIGIDYYESICVWQDWPYDLPVAMDAPWQNDRIMSQRGSFTFHGNNPAPLEQTFPKSVARVDIPPHLARPLRAELARSGIDHFRLFPDLDGLAKSLKVQFKF